MFTALLVFRLINAFTIQSFFQPDEYFQSLEPAWKNAFGPQSGAWITWEWHDRLRSAIHPLLFSVVYRATAQLTRILGVSPHIASEVLLRAPKALQACLAAVTDFCTWRLACKVYAKSRHETYAALALTVCSPWQWFCSVRTLSNSLETALTVLALKRWPWRWFLPLDNAQEPVVKSGQKSDSDQKVDVSTAEQLRSFLNRPDDTTAPKSMLESEEHRNAVPLSPSAFAQSLIAAALACILRPTNLLIWATISVVLISRFGSYAKVVKLTTGCLTYGSAVLAVSIGADRAFYGVWTFPPFRFLYFNLVQSLAVFYGANRPDYYFTEGLPLLLIVALPFAALGMWQALRPGLDRPTFAGYKERQIRFVLAVTVITSVLALSLISHKEVRFIYPLLPMLHVLAAKPLAAFFQPFPVPKSKLRLGILILGLTINIYIAAYVSLVHQRGVIDVVHYLRHEHEARHIGPRTMTVGFLMPCHSTPWRSHLVYPTIDAWALTCEPPLNLSLEERKSYLDEADIFYADPNSWLRNHMQPLGTISRTKLSGSSRARRGNAAYENSQERRPWPDYLVFFAQLEPTLDSILADTSYEECWRGFNTHWHDDGRRQGDVVVWCMPRTSPPEPL